MATPYFIIECLPDFESELPRFLFNQGILTPAQAIEWRQQLDTRINIFTKFFNISVQPINLGDFLLYKEGAHALQIFTTSDSFCWSNLDKAYLDDPNKLESPPSDLEQLRANADALLSRTKLQNEYTNFHSIEYNTVVVKQMDVPQESISLKVEARQEAIPTLANVRYAFSIGSKTVFGPGAKIQVGYTGDYELCEFLYFWRNPLANGKHAIISPDKALAIFQEDDRFKELDPRTSSIRILSMQLGYYAFPPFISQMHTLPVYQFRGVVDTETHKGYEFILHLVALDMSAMNIVKQGFLPDSEFPLVF